MRVTDEVMERLRALNTPTLANALDDLGFAGVMSGIQAVGAGLRCVGRAVTARETTGPKGSFPIDDFRVGDIIEAAGRGDVIVIDNGGHAVSTWGGMASYAAKRKGIAGIVIDGSCRDREEIVEFGFPAFSRHVVPTPGKTRIRVEAIGGTVVCGGVRVRPGDIVVADGSGVVVIPEEAAAEVAEQATRFAADDRTAMREMDAGLTFKEALAKFKKI
jgi:regulator of RNase E activity RraA